LGSTLALGLGGSLLALLASVISIKFLEPV
jgi:hypothetical protein